MYFEYILNTNTDIHFLCMNYLDLFKFILLIEDQQNPGGGAPGGPPIKNNEGVLLRLYFQKTFWEGTHFRFACKNWTTISKISYDF